MNYAKAEAGVGGIAYRDLTRQDVEEETTGMYLWRVLVGYPFRTSAPPVKTADGRSGIERHFPRKHTKHWLESVGQVEKSDIKHRQIINLADTKPR